MVGLSRSLALCVAVVAAFPQLVGTARSIGEPGLDASSDGSRQPASETPPREWIEPVSGHRVIRLSDAPGSASLYFHQNQYTAAGDKMVFSTKDGLSTINFKTRKIEAIVEGRAGKVHRRKEDASGVLYDK